MNIYSFIFLLLITVTFLGLYQQLSLQFGAGQMGFKGGLSELFAAAAGNGTV